MPGEDAIHGEVLYANDFDKDPAAWAEERARDWAMEGPGVVRCAGGILTLHSENFTVPRAKDGHFVFWLKREFPPNVAIEWDFRHPAEGEQGLAILFWAAKGRGGEDLFDPSLPARNTGNFDDYHSGAMDCYHISYVARSRKCANLRKNHGFHLVASGNDLVTAGGPDRWHHLRLTQDEGQIRLDVNGQTCIDWTDDGETYGPVLRRGGKIGFRQQNNLYRGEYANLRVRALTS